MSKKEYFKATTPRAVAAYAHLSAPDTKGKFADNKYKVTLVFDKDDPGLRNLREQAVKAAKQEWPKASESAIAFPFKNGDEKTNKDGSPKEDFAGKILITAKTQQPPALIDSKRNPLPKSVKIYSGDIIKASITFNVSTPNGKKTVGVWLNGVQLCPALRKA